MIKTIKDTNKKVHEKSDEAAGGAVNILDKAKGLHCKYFKWLSELFNTFIKYIKIINIVIY